MLAIKILTGQQMGKVIPIKEGASFIGRAPECDIILPSNNVSKKHAQFEKQGNLLILTDLKSTNGSFVNGIKVESAKVHPGDKISFHDMVIEVISNGAAAAAGGLIPYVGGNKGGGGENALALSEAQLALAPQLEEEDIIQPYDPPVEVFKKKANRYMETVVLPGVYRLPELLDFQWVIGGFFVLMVVISTSLSVIPLLKILKSSIEEASRRNVYNIVTEMTSKNKDALHKRIFSAVDLDETLRRQGVERAFITDVRGEIILPARYAGKTPTIKNFHTGRKLAGTTPYIDFVDSKNILGIQAIKYYDTKKSIETTRYYSVILYNVDARMMDPNRTLSLFVQTLALSLVAALIMYFFVSRLISYPIRVLNNQIDHKLRTGEDVLKSPFQYRPLQKLYSNLNSALNRMPENDGGNQQVFEYDRSREMQNIVELMADPAVAIRASDDVIEGYNSGFEYRTGLKNMAGTSVSQITEQALKLAIQDLIDRVKETPDDIVHNNDFEFSGEPYQIALQAIYGATTIAYYIVTFIPVEGDG